MHVIIGAGAIGTSTARLLAERGERVRVITRSGGGPQLSGVERIAADAADAQRLTELVTDATAIYNCANPKYHRWATDWPPLAASLLQAAERTGAVLVTMGNLYGYGPVDVPMTEDLPLRPAGVKARIRARMWQDALALHEAGRVRATEARASDFIGFRANSVFADLVLANTVRGRRGYVLAEPDAPHSLSAIDDAARTLVAIGADERAWGRPWHVPTAAALSQRAAAIRAHQLLDLPAPKLLRVPEAVIWAGGLFSPIMKELRETRYQFLRPFVLDSSLTERTFGLAATPLDESLAATARAYLAGS
jgi:nucleoside-diphosphate-sugar epimerase